MIIPSSNWAVRVFNPIFPVIPVVNIVDENNNILDTITMQNSAECLAMTARALNSNTDWYCTDKEISVSTVDGKIKKIRISPDFGMPIPDFFITLGFI